MKKRDISFDLDKENLTVVARGKSGGSIRSQSVEALLLLAILDELKEIRLSVQPVSRRF